MSRSATLAGPDRPGARLPLGWLGLSSIVIPLCVVGAVAATISPWLGVAVAVLAAPVIWLVHRPVLVAAVAAGVVPATSGVARGLPIPGLRVSEVLVFGAAWVVLVLHSRNLPVSRWRAFDYLALAFTSATAAFAVINAAAGRWEPDYEGVQLSLGMLQFLLLYRVVVVGLWHSRARELGLRLLLAMSIPVSILAVLQQVFPDPFQSVAVAITQTSVFDTPGFDPVNRATSVFHIWHALAGYLLVVLFISIALILAGDRRVVRRPTLVLITALAVASVVATLTFTSFIGLALGTLILAWRFGRLGRVLALGTVAALAAAAAFWPLLAERLDEQSVGTTVEQPIPFLPETLQYRIAVWIEQYAPAFPDSYAIGLGPTLPATVSWEHTESAYLTVMLRGGVVFLLLLVLLQVGAALLGWAAHARADRASDRAIGAAAGTLAIVLIPMNAVFPYITNGGLAQPAWVLWGLAASILVGSARPLPPVATGAARPTRPAPPTRAMGSPGADHHDLLTTTGPARGSS